MDIHCFQTSIYDKKCFNSVNLLDSSIDVGLSCGSLAKQPSKTELTAFLNTTASPESRLENPLIVEPNWEGPYPSTSRPYIKTAKLLVKAFLPPVAKLNNIHPRDHISPYGETFSNGLPGNNSGARYGSELREDRDCISLFPSKIVENPKSAITHRFPNCDGWQEQPPSQYKTGWISGSIWDKYC